MATLADVLTKLEDQTTLLREVVKKLTKGIGAAAPGAPAPPPAQVTAGVGPGGAFAALTAPVGRLGAALSGAVGALTLIPNAVKAFVEALSPAQVANFMDAIQDLMATIGQAFEPIFQVFTPLVRTISDMVAPVFEALRPIVLQLSEMLGRVLIPIVRLVVTAFEGLAPILRALMPVLDFLVSVVVATIDVYRVFQVLLNAIWEYIGMFLDFLGSFIGPMGGLEANVRNLSSVVQQLTRQFILMTAYVLKFLGFLTALQRLREAFEPAKGLRKTAAPKDFGLTGIEDILREATLAAAAAGGGMAPRTVEDHLAGIGEQIDAILEHAPTFVEMGEALAYLWYAGTQFVNWLAKQGERLGQLPEQAGRIWRRVRDAPGDVLDRLFWWRRE